MPNKCIATGCDRIDIRAHGVCGRHYYHWLKYGDPNKYLRQGDKERGSLTRDFLGEYRSYNSMKTRCYNKNYPQYKDYGGRGIRVCKRWLGPNGFRRFLDDMGPRPIDKSLDRIDVNGDYTPGNCRWATRKEQSNNTRNNRLVEYEGEVHTIPEWAQKKGFPQMILYNRIMLYKWNIKRALETPYKKRPRRTK